MKKEGKVTIHWTTGSGVPKIGVFKVVSSVARSSVSTGCKKRDTM